MSAQQKSKKLGSLTFLRPSKFTDLLTTIMPNLEFLEGRTQQSLTNWTTWNERKTTAHSQKGRGNSFVNKEQDHMPSRKRASKTPPTESNKNDNSKQEFHESQAKIFKWKSNPVMANWCTSRNTAFLIIWSYLYYRNINHLWKLSISFSNCFGVQSFSNADLHSFQSYLSSKNNSSENMIKRIVAPTIISFFNFNIQTMI